MALTAADVKNYIETSLPNEQLDLLLGAAYADIDNAIGPVGNVSEWHSPHGDLIMLGSRAQVIVSVLERAQSTSPTTLAADDYQLSTDGWTLRRLRGGTNAAYHWHPKVNVTFTPWSDEDERDRVAISLVKLDLTHQPGIASQTIGSWSETFSPGDTSYTEQRRAILASLGAPFLIG